MSGFGPRFLDEEEPPPPTPTPRPAQGSDPAPPVLPRGPVLLDAKPDAASRLDVGWTPEVVTTPRPVIGTAFWVIAGLFTIVGSWVMLSAVSFVLTLLAQSLGVGIAAAIALLCGCTMLAYAGLREARAYRSLGTVERLRAILMAGDTTVEVARQQVSTWLDQVGTGVPDHTSVRRMLQASMTVAEVRSVVRSQIADRLHEAANGLGRRAAIEGATLVAICPHPAWDGAIAGWRGLLVVRQVAALYGLRPGLAVTLALVRRVAWTAAGTTGLSLVSQGLADHALGSLPVLKHVAGALPGTGVVAMRLYRLAGITAEACSPTS